MSLVKLPRLCEGIMSRIQPRMVQWTRASPPSKQHLDRFSRLYTAHRCAKHTDTQTTSDICRNGPYAMRAYDVVATALSNDCR